MKEILLLKDGEIVLKGLNRRQFEDVLKKNIKNTLSPLGKFEITSAQSTVSVKPLSDDIDLDEACERVGRIFGIVSYSRAALCDGVGAQNRSRIPRKAAQSRKDL